MIPPGSAGVSAAVHRSSAANETLQVLKRHNEGLYHMYLILTRSPGGGTVVGAADKYR